MFPVFFDLTQKPDVSRGSEPCFDRSGRIIFGGFLGQVSPQKRGEIPKVSSRVLGFCWYFEELAY